MRRVAVAPWGVCLFVVGQTLGICSAWGKPSPLRAEEGQAALAAGDAALAWTLLAPCASLQGASPEVRFWAAEAAALTQHPQEALTLLANLDTELVAVADEIWARRARLYTAQGAFAAAIDAWHKTLAHEPATAILREAQFALGPLYLAQGNALAAILAFRTAIATAPKDARSDAARLRIAGLEQDQGNLKDAETMLMRLAATAKDPVAQEAAVALANLQAPLSRQTQAPLVLTPAQDVTFENRTLWQTARTVRDAQRLVAQRKPEEAIALLRELVRRSTKAHHATATLELGNLLATLGRTDEALATYDRLIATLGHTPMRRDAQFRAAYLSYDAGHWAAARKRYGTWLGQNPRSPSADEALWYMAWSAFHLTQYEAALVDLQRLRRQFPKSVLAARAAYWCGRILALRSRFTEAVQAYGQAAVVPGYYGMMARMQRDVLEQRYSKKGRAKNPVAPLAMAALSPRAQILDAPKGPLQAFNLQTLTHPAPDDGSLAQMLAQGSLVLAWDSPKGARVATLIRLGLRKEAAYWVGSLPALPGVASAQASLGRGRILYALGDYTLAMRHVAPALPQRDEGPFTSEQSEALMLAYPLAYGPEVALAAETYQVSDLLLLSIMRQESAFNTQASSSVRAQGLMQIMPATGRKIAQRLNKTDYQDALLTQPAVNVGFGAWYVRALLDKFNGNLALAIGAYNAGPQATQRWLPAHQNGPTDVYIEDVPYKETRDYIKKVLGNLAVYTALYQKDVVFLSPLVAGNVGNQVDF